MTETIVRAANSEEVWTSERCYIREIVNHESIPEYSLAESRVEAGVTTQLHSLGVREWYVIMRGTGLMEIDGGPQFAVGPGDAYEIPAGISQRISNTGDTDILLQCVCMPRFTMDCYNSLEED